MKNEQMADFTSNPPSHSEWIIWVAPGFSFAINTSGEVPNCFQRWMQKQLLGWRWEYVG